MSFEHFTSNHHPLANRRHAQHRSFMVGAAALLAILATIVCQTQPVAAYPEWQQLIPNSGLCEYKGVAWPAVGHTTPLADTDDDDNQFGEDFEDFGETWNYQFCMHDSDGDGFTNGMELGDPDCVWKVGDIPSRTHTISHPSFADSTPIFTPAPPTPAPTPAPTLPPGSSVSVTPSATFTEVNGKMKYSWTLVLNDPAVTTDDEIELTMEATGNFYVSLGVSPQLMDGPMIACIVSGGKPFCSDWMGVKLAITPMTAFSSVVSSSTVGSGYRITVKCLATTLGIKPFQTQRVIFATGGYNTGTNVPLQHTAADRTASNVDFYSIVTVGGPTPAPTAAPTPAPTPVPPTPAPTPAPTLDSSVSMSVEPSATFTEVNGKMKYSWNMTLNDPTITTDDEIELTMSGFGGEHYVSVGVSPQLMDGPMVICYVPAATGSAKCRDYMGVGIAINDTPQFSTVVRSARGTGRRQGGEVFSVTVRFVASKMSVKPFQSQRLIFATGNYDVASDTFAAHNTVDRTVNNVDMYSVVKVAGPTPAPTPVPPTPAPPAVTVPPIAANTAVAARSTANLVTPDGGMTFDWFAYNNSANMSDVVIEMTMNTTKDQYVSFGVSPSLMNGPMVACYVPQDGSTGKCSDWMGVNLAISQMEQHTELVSYELFATGGFSVTVRFVAGKMAVRLGSQRVIFAVGQYNYASNIPLIHTPSDRSIMQVDLLSGAARDVQTQRGFKTAVIVIAVSCGLVLVGCAVMNFGRIVLGPVPSLAARVLVCVWFIALLLTYVLLNERDYRESLRSYPLERAMGDGAALCFWFILYPVPKHLGVVTVAGSSFERLITYHTVIGIAVFVLTTLHFVLMLLTFEKRSKLFSTDGPNPVLYGFLAWLGTAIIVLSSVLLRRKFYGLFRWLHWLFIPTLVFSVLHYPKMLWALLPPIINLVVDYGVRLGSDMLSAGRLVECDYDAEAKVTHLAVAIDGEAHSSRVPGAGQFVMLGLEGQRNPHPFSVAWVSKDRKSDDGGDGETKPGASSITTTCHFYVKGFGEIAENSRAWTGQLCARAAAKTLPLASSVTFMGPYGELQVPLTKTKQKLLVAGGIGVTPILSILQELMQMDATDHRYDEDPVDAPSKGKIVVVWTLRDMSLANTLAPYFRRVVQTISTLDRIELYYTGKQLLNISEESLAAEKFSPNDTAVVEMKELSRPTDNSDVYRVIAQRPNLKEVMETSFGKSGPAVTLYCCGPDALMDAAGTAARGRPNTLLHTETFEV